MLSALSGRVGIAPGTTTMTLGQSERAHGPGFPPGSRIVGGAMMPHDFQLSHIFGYLPYMQGWTVGRIAPSSVAAGGLAGGGGLRESLRQAQQDQALELQIQKLEEEVKTLQHSRLCAAIGAAVGIGGLLVAVLALRSRGR